MKNNYLTVAACLFLFYAGSEVSVAQSGGPEFLDCSTAPISLCVSDDGVRLPSNNKVYLGEENPEATSCSVHLTQKTTVQSTCGKNLQYEVQLFLFDTSTAYILQPLTTIATDSLFEAELSYDSEFSPESFIRENGIPYTTGCMRYHRIKWIVTDSCGIVAICEKQIDLYDCFEPVYSIPIYPYVAHFSIGGWSALVRLDSVVIDPIDDCTTHDVFLYSFSPVLYEPDSTFFACNEPVWGVELFYDIWIADEGRDLNCDGFINWDERQIQKEQINIVFVDDVSIDCWDGTYDLFGKIRTEHYGSVANVAVSLTNAFSTYVTVEDGKYQFRSISPYSEYTIHAARNDLHKNGVSTLDLVRILKHLLGIEALSSPYELIAADANNSQSVSAIDLVELRKLILGKYTELPANERWRFVPEDFVFEDTLHPWPFDETLTLMVNGDVYDADFIGIKIGDVNNTVQANVQSLQNRELLPEVKWHVDQKKYLSNEFIDINFYIDDVEAIQGFQFTISDPDLEFIDVSSENINLTAENFALFGDKITLSWFDEDGIQFLQDDIVFTLKARVQSSGDLKNNLSINSQITNAEVYSIEDEIFYPKLLVLENETNPVFLPPEPNPWKEKTTIPFVLKKSGNVTFEIFDLNGRLIYTERKTYDAGYNTFNIRSDQFEERGILYFSIKTRDSISTDKMILLE